jgi:hypothetical protein
MNVPIFASTQTQTQYERLAFVENVVFDDHVSPFRDVLRRTLQRIEHDTAGTVVSVRVNMVRHMTAPEIARLNLDPTQGTWLELIGDVLRVPTER